MPLAVAGDDNRRLERIRDLVESLTKTSLIVCPIRAPGTAHALKKERCSSSTVRSLVGPPRSPATLVSVRYHIGEDSIMPNLLIRDLDDDVLQELKAAAKAHGRSLQAEIHEVLRRANTRNLAETRRLSAKWLKRLRRRGHSDSAALIREDRGAR